MTDTAVPTPRMSVNEEIRGHSPNRSQSQSTLEHGKGHGVGQQKPHPGLQKFSYDFFAPEIAHLRALYTKIILSSTILLVLIIWVCFPVYWGSLWKAPTLTHQLRAWVIDREGGPLGQAVSQSIMATTTSRSKVVLGWQQIDPAQFTTDQDIINAVVDERTWIAVVVEPNASNKLAVARQTGDASYNASTAISIYYAQGRNEIAVGSYILPIVQPLLGRILGQFNAKSVAGYIAANSGNSTALQLLSQAPQTLSQPIWYTLFNVRPYTAQVASAVTLVGHIYIVIIAFFTAMSGSGAREIIGPFLNTTSLIKLRIVVPLLIYLPLSLLYAMISLPFKLPFGAKYSYSGGFFLFLAMVYAGMAALGLACEAAATLLSNRFMGFFLLPLILVNISVTVLPLELEVWFYKYGLGFPVYNMSQAVRTIIFNTKNHLGRNFGVLLAWVVLSLITLPTIQYLKRRHEIAAEQARPRGDESMERAREAILREEYGRGTTAEVDERMEREIENAERLDEVALKGQ